MGSLKTSTPASDLQTAVSQRSFPAFWDLFYLFASQDSEARARGGEGGTGGGAASGGVTGGGTASWGVTGHRWRGGQWERDRWRGGQWGVTGGVAASVGVTGGVAATVGVTGDGAANVRVTGGGAASGARVEVRAHTDVTAPPSVRVLAVLLLRGAELAVAVHLHRPPGCSIVVSFTILVVPRGKLNKHRLR